MRTFYFKSPKSDLYNKILKKNFHKHNNSIEYRNSRDSFLEKLEKSKSNISENESFKKIKLKNNNLLANKTFYNKNYKNCPFHLSSVPKKNNNIYLFNSIKEQLKIKEANIFSRNKALFNHSNINFNKHYDYTIYLKNDFKDNQYNNKKYDLKIPKPKDLNKNMKHKYFIFAKNTKDNNILSLKHYVKSKSNDKEKKESNEKTNNHISRNNYNNFQNSLKETISQVNDIPQLINNDKKNYVKTVINKPLNSLNVSKKNIKTTLNNKNIINLGSTMNSVENIESIKKDSNKTIKKVNSDLSTDVANTKNSIILIPSHTIEFNIISTEKKVELNNRDSIKNIKKLNFDFLSKNKDSSNNSIPKVMDYNCDDSLNFNLNKKPIKSIIKKRNRIENMIKNGGEYLNLNSKDNSNKNNNNNAVKNINTLKNTTSSLVDIHGQHDTDKTLITFKREEELIIKDETEKFINKRNSDGCLQRENIIKEKFFFFKKKKYKFLNLIPIKEKEVGEKNKKFLNKIKTDNVYKFTNYKLTKNIKKIKKIILTNQMDNISETVSKEHNNLKECAHNSAQNLENTLKNYFIEAYKQKKKKYKNIYLDLKENITKCLLNELMRQSFNKCSLNINIINFITFNNSLSSIYLPLGDLSKKRRHIFFLQGKLALIEKSFNFLENKKSKFVESKRSRKIFHNLSFHYISKELYYINIESKMKNSSSDKNGKDNLNTKRFLRSNYSYQGIFGKKKKRNSDEKNSYRDPKGKENLSILQKGHFFDLPSKNNNNIGPFRRNFKKRTAINNKYNRIAYKNNIALYDFIKGMTEKDNTYSVLKKLIKDEKIQLFMDFFENNERIIDINVQDQDGNTFLILCVKEGLNEIAKFLLDKGIDINIQNDEGNSALHYALSSKNFKMADILRKYGASESCENKLGLTPWDSIGKSIDKNG